MSGTNPLATFAASNYATMSGSAYPNQIDSNSVVSQRIVDCFAAHEQSSPNMTVRLDAGYLYFAPTLTEVAAQNTGTITAPVSNPRIDRIVINSQTGAVAVVTGAEAGSPVAPALTTSQIPIARVLLQTSTTAITNAIITDERALFVTERTILAGGDRGGQGQVVSVRGGMNDSVTVSIDLLTDVAGIMGILLLSMVNESNALLATRTIYGVIGRGTSVTLTSLMTGNGTSGGASFTATISDGTLHLTNTSGSRCDYDVTFFSQLTL